MPESRSFVGVSRVVDGAQLDAALSELANLRAENARLREAAREAQHVAKVFDFNDGCKAVDRILEAALKEPGDPKS